MIGFSRNNKNLKRKLNTCEESTTTLNRERDINQLDANGVFKEKKQRYNEYASSEPQRIKTIEEQLLLLTKQIEANNKISDAYQTTHKSE